MKIAGKIKNLKQELNRLGNKEKARFLARFFKTGEGEYGAGDLFLGITVPVARKVAQKYSELSFPEIAQLPEDKYHEARSVALLILVHRFKKSKSENEKKKIFDFYLTQTKHINNWDLVDLSASYIVGNYLADKDPEGKQVPPGAGRKILEHLAKSKNIWERRIAMIATFAFIYRGNPSGLIKLHEYFWKTSMT